MSRKKPSNDGMNLPERRLLAAHPLLERVSSNQKPRELEVMVPKRLNPDFKLYEPPFAGIWVEVKGHLCDGMWFPALKAMPEWFRDRYRVVLVNKNKAEQARYAKQLEAIGVHWAIEDVPHLWYQDAFSLYLDNNGRTFTTDVEGTGLAKLTVTSDCSFREVL